MRGILTPNLGFDIGSSTNVVITGANVYNQDDCVAVNSGTVRA
jgi:polygalacturonase